MRTLGLRGSELPSFRALPVNAVLQSLSQKSKIFASSLYTREPGCSRTSKSVGVDALIDPSYLLVDFSIGPMKGIDPCKNSPGCPKTIL